MSGDALKRDHDLERTIGPLLSLGERVLITGDYIMQDVLSGLTVITIEMEVLSKMPILFYGPARIAERPGDSYTSIDITLVSPGLVPETLCTLFPLLGSDHRS